MLSCTDEDRSLSVMSFNIRYDNPDDGAQAWEKRKPLVAAFLKEQAPDIIGFQEALHHQYEQLQHLLSAYNSVGAGRDDGKEKGEYVPVFYRKDKYELLASSHFWLSETPEQAGSKSWGAALPRIVTWLQLKDRNSGYIFYVFNTHFSHVSAHARNESAVLLLHKIRTIAESAPVILTGDFNAPASERMFTSLTNNWEDYDQLSDSRSLTVGTEAPMTPTFNGFSTQTTPIAIDHIFVNGFFDAESFTTHEVIKDGTFISDHYPITARLSFRMNQRDARGESKTLMQRLRTPFLNTGELCFYDSLLIDIRPQGSETVIYYTLNGALPDDSTAQKYVRPFYLKKSATLRIKAFAEGMFPSPVSQHILIKRKAQKAKLINVVPAADAKYQSEGYRALFDCRPGNSNVLNDGSWCGFNGTDTDFLFELPQRGNISEVYISCLSQPAMWIATPARLEIKTSNDGLAYQVVAAQDYQPQFNESIRAHQVMHLPMNTRARYVKISVYNAGLLPPGHSAQGNPSWTFIDEIVLQ